MPPLDQIDDNRDLASLGYKPVLNRTLGSFSAFAAGFSYISILTGVFQMFYLGYGEGGPAFFWTWPVVLLGQMTVALCFAELAARYPLSGGVYQWSRRTGGRAIGWLAGWIDLCGLVVTLAAVALALQGPLPQISPALQVVGDPSVKADSARNAVILGCALIAATTIINVGGVRLMSRINNVGVIAELVGVLLLVGLLFAHARRGPAILLDTRARADGASGYLGPALAAALMASYVLYGFDTAGTLAEETGHPRRRAPRAILQALAAAGLAGAMLIAAAILSVGDPHRAELGHIAGGLPMIVKDVLGPGLGRLFLIDVVFAIFVCALAVHAGSVRLIFAMARDNNLPCARALGRVPRRTRAPALPAVLIGALAAGLLVVNIDHPHVIETLCAVAIAWVNLAYLLVTLPMLVVRLRRRWDPEAWDPTDSRLFSMGRLGLPINAIASAWSLFVVVNVSWPRTEIYGPDPLGRFAAPLSTLGLLALGGLYYAAVQRRRPSGTLAEHRPESLDPPSRPAAPAGRSIEGLCIGRLAAHE